MTRSAAPNRLTSRTNPARESSTPITSTIPTLVFKPPEGCDRNSSTDLRRRCGPSASLRPCASRLRIHGMRALRCSVAPSIWTTSPPQLSPTIPVAPLALQRAHDSRQGSELLHHRPHRPRQIHAGRPPPGVHRVDQPARYAEPGARLHG